jgi:hypothetical protein
VSNWAEIDENNIVVRVLAGDDTNGEEAAGQTLKENLGGEWIQTSYTGRIRGIFAGIGDTYDPELDAFIPPKPFDSWILNQETFIWEAPVAYPNDGLQYLWDESSTVWVEVANTTES